jgi:hypothetical protein
MAIAPPRPRAARPALARPRWLRCSTASAHAGGLAAAERFSLRWGSRSASTMHGPWAVEAKPPSCLPEAPLRAIGWCRGVARPPEATPGRCTPARVSHPRPRWYRCRKGPKTHCREEGITWLLACRHGGPLHRIFGTILQHFYSLFTALLQDFYDTCHFPCHTPYRMRAQRQLTRLVPWDTQRARIAAGPTAHPERFSDPCAHHAQHGQRSRRRGDRWPNSAYSSRWPTMARSSRPRRHSTSRRMS